MLEKEKSVAEHYDAASANYHEQYEEKTLLDVSKPYPANYFRLQLLIHSFLAKGLKKIIEVGVGEGTPLVTLAKAGMDVWGFDISEQMVKKSQDTIRKSGGDASRIFWADIEDPATYRKNANQGQFDGLMAMGVMPHVKNDDEVLDNMASLVRPGGSVFIEFRNKLFSLFTFNRYTVDFILNDLLSSVSPELKKSVARDLESRCRMDLPKKRESIDGKAPGYDAILSKFHNPFEVTELFKRHGFEQVKLLWYHYHPAMPFLADSAPEVFRREAIRLEFETSNWKGLFLCSAFVVEAVRGKA